VSYFEKLTKSSMRVLQRGDIIRSRGSGNSYVITESHGGDPPTFTAVDSFIVTNPDEWLVYREDEDV
jgi:hypothetical protein